MRKGVQTRGKRKRQVLEPQKQQTPKLPIMELSSLREN